MPRNPDQILAVRQMRAAEQALIDAGTSVEALMDTAGRGAAEWVWRLAAHRPVTVLCGPGNNGGDGYVIAEALRERSGKVVVVAAAEPTTAAAKNARSLFKGEVRGPDALPGGEVLVDCLFGSGLARPLSPDHHALLCALARSHKHRVAVDLPSGIESDSGAALNDDLPAYDLTTALGAWKFAHFLMPASARLGALRLVGIGVEPVDGAAQAIAPPSLRAPTADAHKYRRGLLGVVGGEMPGAAVLACIAAQGAGAGYVKLLCGPARSSGRAGVEGDPSENPDLIPDFDSPNSAQAEPVEAQALPFDLVCETKPLTEALADKRLSAILIGPGLGRGLRARDRLSAALEARIPTVADADALILLQPTDPAPSIATPHDGELAALERAFGLAATATTSKPERARALAGTSGMIVVAKGPDTVIAAPDGRLALAARASSWLSTAGTGDVLAGTIASRLAAGVDPFDAACQGVWLHAEAARLYLGPFTAEKLARAVPAAFASAL